jgi:hypothetical protein
VKTNATRPRRPPRLITLIEIGARNGTAPETQKKKTWCVVAAKHQRCGAHAAFTEECFGSVTRKTKEKTAPPSFCRRACRIKETRRFCLELKVAAVRLGLIRPTYETSN